MNHPGGHVRAAGGGPALENEAQTNAQQHAAEKGTQQRIVGHGLQGQKVDQQGKDHRRAQRTHGKGAPHGAIADQKQRDVHQNAGCAYGPAEQIVEHGRQTSHAAGGNVIGHQKPRIGHGSQQTAQ